MSNIPAAVLAQLTPAQRAALQAVPTQPTQPQQPAAEVAPPAAQGWQPDFNAARKASDYGKAGGGKVPYFDWKDEFDVLVVLQSVKNVHHRKGDFYVALMTVVESSNPKYAPGSEWQKSFNYFPMPRCEAEEDRNKFSFKELAELAAVAHGKHPLDKEFDANWGVGELLAKSKSQPSLDMVLRYKQESYTNKHGHPKIGVRFEVAG